MRAFGEYNPAVVFFCLMSCAVIAMFSVNPVIVVLSLVGAAALWFARNGWNEAKSLLIYPSVLVIVPLLNMLISHNGMTVLFVLNDNPITLESLLFGAVSAVMLASVLWWFRSFSQIMTSDKLLYLLGSLSPKLALLLTMALRYVPLFGRQAKKIDNAQRVMGLYKEEDFFDNAKGRLRVCSVLITWALENGIITADSMTARGYGVGRRTSFSLYRFRRSDGVTASLQFVLTCVCTVGMATGAVDYSFYPAADKIPFTPMAWTVYVCYGIMAVLPALIELEVRVRWRSLRSAI